MGHASHEYLNSPEPATSVQVVGSFTKQIGPAYCPSEYDFLQFPYPAGPTLSLQVQDSIITITEKIFQLHKSARLIAMSE